MNWLPQLGTNQISSMTELFLLTIRHCALVISRQPFPEVIINKKELGGEVLQVQLLTGACVNLINVGKVKAELVSDNVSNKCTMSNTEQVCFHLAPLNL